MDIKIKLSFTKQSKDFLKRKMDVTAHFIGKGLANTMKGVLEEAYSKYGFEQRALDTERKYLSQGYDYDPDAMKKTGESIQSLKDTAAGKQSNMSENLSTSHISDELKGEIIGHLRFTGRWVNYWNDHPSYYRPVRVAVIDEIISNGREMVEESICRAFEAKRPRGY